MPIDPQASVHPTAEIDPTAEIGPGCIVGAGARIGAHTKLWPNVFVAERAIIGAENELHMGVVIGHVPQDLGYDNSPTLARIGDRNTFREYATVHRASRPDGETVVGNDNFFMCNTHIAHDATVGSNVIIANASCLAGHAQVDDGAFISANVLVHQFVRVGRLVMVAPLSTVLQDFPPFSLGGGRRAQVHGMNVVGMRRAGLDKTARLRVQRDQRTLYRSGLTTTEALEVLKQERSLETNELIAFVEDSRRGIASFGPSEREANDSDDHFDD